MSPRLPEATAADIAAAAAEFDRTQRASYNFRANKYLACIDGRAYPPKILIAIATGRSVREFSGGEESHRYLKKRGVRIVSAATGEEI